MQQSTMRLATMIVSILTWAFWREVPRLQAIKADFVLSRYHVALLDRFCHKVLVFKQNCDFRYS